MTWLAIAVGVVLVGIGLGFRLRHVRRTQSWPVDYVSEEWLREHHGRGR